MDGVEIEENVFVAGDPKLHGGMYKLLSAILSKVLEIFPFIEASRPRSKSGIQALCSLHVALDRAKNLLQHCSECSKLYLAITEVSVLMKFEKTKFALQESLRRIVDIVPEAIGCQIVGIVGELEKTVFELDPSEKQAGLQIISLLQRDRMSESNDELEVFHQAALRLGITSSRAALTERRALKKLAERARSEEDRRKESVVSYLYNLMKKYSKLFRSDFADDIDSQGSSPCSPIGLGLDEVSSSYTVSPFERQLSKLRSFNCKQTGRSSLSMPVPPEEFRCPISLQLMSDPVIISSGQTYERGCIEKWFRDGHTTCPKTQQQLCHLNLTPNYCVKGLIASWCERNGISTPESPLGSLDGNYWKLAFSQYEATDSGSFPNNNACKQKGINLVPLEDNDMSDVKGYDEDINNNLYQDNSEVDQFSRYLSLLEVLHEAKSTMEACSAAEQIRYLLKDNEEARILLADNGAVGVLIQFLRLAVNEKNEKAQEIGAMALFNLAVNSNRNKGLLLAAGIIPLLEEMISNSETCEFATALYLNLSCLDEAKSVIGSTVVLLMLVQILRTDSGESSTCKHDALYTLYNLSTHSPNIPALVSAGVIDVLKDLLAHTSEPDGITWSEKALAVLINLASSSEGREEIASNPSLVSELAGVLDIGEPAQQEQAVSCLLIICTSDERCCQMVLQEGIIPSLVSISVSGTTRGMEKAHKLLKFFREQRQRQRESSPVRQQTLLQQVQSNGSCRMMESKTLCKSKSKKLAKTLSSFWKNKNFSVSQC